MQPQVADRSAGVSAGHDRVIGEERVEYWRCADPPGGGVLQALYRHRLDPGDAAVVDPGGGECNHTALCEIVSHLPCAVGLPFPLVLTTGTPMAWQPVRVSQFPSVGRPARAAEFMPRTRPVVPPIHHSVTYFLDDQAYKDIQHGGLVEHWYGRFPTRPSTWFLGRSPTSRAAMPG